MYNSPVSNLSLVKSLILNHRLSPYHKQSSQYKEECPICFLTQPAGDTNTTVCCGNPICTDCLVQLVFACPASPTIIPERRLFFSRVPAVPERYTPPACPYCAHPDIAARYHKAEQISSSDIRPRSSNADTLVAATLLSPTAQRTPQQQELINSALTAAATLSNRVKHKNKINKLINRIPLGYK